MKRVILAAAVLAAAVIPTTAANADHICIPGRPERCINHPIITIDQICVTSGGNPVVCVP